MIMGISLTRQFSHLSSGLRTNQYILLYTRIDKWKPFTLPETAMRVLNWNIDERLSCWLPSLLQVLGRNQRRLHPQPQRQADRQDDLHGVDRGFVAGPGSALRLEGGSRPGQHHTKVHDQPGRFLPNLRHQHHFLRTHGRHPHYLLENIPDGTTTNPQKPPSPCRLYQYSRRRRKLDASESSQDSTLVPNQSDTRFI